MADNVVINGTPYATDDVGGVQYPYSKVAFGANNTATPVSDTNPLPIAVKSEPMLNWAAGVKVAGNNASQLLITPPAGCNLILIEPTGDVFIRADGQAAADAAGSMRYGSKDIIPVVAGVAVRVWAASGTTVYAVPYV